MSKRPLRQPRRKNSDDTYSTRMPKEKQAERNRVAVRAYYERNQESIREKRRIGMAQKKAEKQLRHRRWDPPKKPVPDPAPTVQSDGGKSQGARAEANYSSWPPVVAFQDIRCLSSDMSLNGIPRDLDPASEPDAAPGTIASRYSCTSAEIAATGVLLSLNRPEIGSLPNALDDRALSQRIAPPNVQSSAGNNADDTGFGRKEARLDGNLFKGSQRPQPPLLPAAKPERMTDFATELEGRKYLKPGRLPPGTAALSLMQEISLERTGCVGLLSRVQAGQVRVFEINSAPLTPPTTGHEEHMPPAPVAVTGRVQEIEGIGGDGDARNKIGENIC
ncbi:hypothetical protein C8J57DRAFT_760717 [Mycena rebaudengoi]|nr:hypothetical protein C8J57DRAFT_760717 [Mycena rebaudengoi]